MKKYIISTIVVVIILAVASIAYTFVPETSVPAQGEFQSEARVYENSTHGYTLEYPANLETKEYGPDNVVFGTITGETVDGIAEASIMRVTGKPGQTFSDAITEVLLNLCAADGPSTSFSCTLAEQVQPFTTASGINGQVMYLRGELTNLRTGEKTLVGKGPFFAFPLQSSATVTNTLIIHAPLHQSAEEADSQAIRLIAESLTLTQSGEASME